MTLTTAVYVAAVAFFYFQQFTKNALLGYLAYHKTDIENKQLTDLQEAHHRRILSLKNQHNIVVHQLQGSLNTIKANLDCLNNEYDWLANMYQDQMRTAQEQEDRVTYLEGKLQESSQLTATMRQPFSAPPSRVQFANPPRRSRFDFTMKLTPSTRQSFPAPPARIQFVNPPRRSRFDIATKSSVVGASSPLAQVNMNRLIAYKTSK
jgi:hypothetical protein